MHLKMESTAVMYAGIGLSVLVFIFIVFNVLKASAPRNNETLLEITTNVHDSSKCNDLGAHN